MLLETQIELRKKRSTLFKAVRANQKTGIFVAYYALIRMSDFKLNPSSFAKDATWVPLKEIDHLPFDHFEILNQSIHYLRNNTKINPWDIIYLKIYVK